MSNRCAIIVALVLGACSNRPTQRSASASKRHVLSGSWQLVPQLLAFSGVQDGDAVLDVGSGAGLSVGPCAQQPRWGSMRSRRCERWRWPVVRPDFAREQVEVDRVLDK